jgi:hypothetical protein
MMVTVLTDNKMTASDDARVVNGDLWMAGAECQRITGQVPHAGGLPEAYFRDGDVNVSAYWRHMHRPVLSDRSGDVWVLGASAKERAAALESLQAPDFKLPDLDGKAHALSDYRGKKIFLASWASW